MKNNQKKLENSSIHGTKRSNMFWSILFIYIFYDLQSSMRGIHMSNIKGIGGGGVLVQSKAR